MSARAAARLLETVVFPSDGLALHMTMTWGWMPFWPENKIEVNVSWKDSANNDGRRLNVARATSCASELGGGISDCAAPRPPPYIRAELLRSEGMTPSSGRLRYWAASPGCCRLRSALSRTSTNITPSTKPPSEPIVALWVGFGLYGAAGGF